MALPTCEVLDMYVFWCQNPSICRQSKDNDRVMMLNSLTACFSVQNWVPEYIAWFASSRVALCLSCSNVAVLWIPDQLESCSSLRNVMFVPSNRLFLIQAQLLKSWPAKSQWEFFLWLSKGRIFLNVGIFIEGIISCGYRHYPSSNWRTVIYWQLCFW